MDIDLRLASEEHDEHDRDELDREEHEHEHELDREEQDDTESNGVAQLLDGEEEKPGGGEGGDVVVFEEQENGAPKEDIRLEPLAGMEFDSLGEAYAFYQEYARSTGFNTAIQNSRRSKTSREFIDAKFACSRYGTKRDYEKSTIRPRSRQGTRHDSENATGRRACAKTDCKASMHVKRRADGKWIIHRFEKEHNHELLPAQAVSEQTRKMYAAMARQFAEYKSLVGLNADSKSPFDKTRVSAVEAGEANCLLDFFTQMQTLNSNFFYAIDIGEDQRLKTFFWADAKSRHDYVNFSDVVSFDTTYVRNKYKMPLVLFVGVNQHYHFMLLGCALVSDETEATYSWVMRTWLKAMGGQAPKILLTDQDMVFKSIVPDIFPSSFHYFFLWQIMVKVTDTLNIVIKQNETFLAKLHKCIHRSWMEEEFEKRWLKLVDRFELKENELMQSLYEDRTKWVPLFLGDAFFAGMSTANRSECVTSYFDKFLHKKTSVQDFTRQYEAILQDRYEEEGKADSDTLNKQPALRSPSPFEKYVANIYTPAVFKRFQVEVLGAVACIPKKERQEEMTITYRVEDFQKNQDFVVTLNQLNSEVSCMCHLFEYKGYLCRHAMIVLQICGISTIPTQYILRRWSRDAKNRYALGEGSEQLQSRVQRYNELCQRAMKLGEEGSLSEESYNFALRALDGALRNCLSVNYSNKNPTDAGTSTTPSLLCIEDNDQRSAGKANKAVKKANSTKKRKVNSEPDVTSVGASDSLQQMDKLSSRPINFDGCFGPQQGVPGMVQLNLMAPTRDNIYANQQSIQGLGQLNTIAAPSQDGFYVHGLGQMDFFRSSNYAYGMREEANIRSAQLHEDPNRHT